MAGVVALAAVNALLAASLVGRMMPDNTAEAQVGRPSDYAMIPARPIGLNQDIIYVLDTANGDLATMGFNQANGQIEFLAPMRLSELFARAAAPPQPEPSRRR